VTSHTPSARDKEMKGWRRIACMAWPRIPRPPR